MNKVTKEAVIFAGNSRWIKHDDGDTGLLIDGMTPRSYSTTLYLNTHTFFIGDMGLGADQNVELVLRVVEEEQE